MFRKEYQPKNCCNITEAAAGLIAAGISAAGAGGQTVFNAAQTKKQREWSEKMTAQQNAWNLEMWNKANEYNSPAAQVERLRDAGLNPLYYGLDGSSANALESAQPLGYEKAQMGDISNVGIAGLQGASIAAEIRNIEADTKKKLSETKMIDAKLPFEVEALRQSVRNSSLDADAKETVNKYLDQMQQAELRVKNLTANELDASVQKAFAEIDKMDYEKLTMMQGWLETHERILNLQKQRDLTDKEMEELSSLIAKNNAEAKKIGLDVKNYDDITVVGTASHTIKVGPISIGEGEPITVAMQKRIEEQKRALREANKNKDKTGDWREDSPYQGPIYD